MNRFWGTQINFLPENLEKLFSDISRIGLKLIEFRAPTKNGETVLETDFISSIEIVRTIVRLSRKYKIDIAYHAPQGEDWNYGKLPLIVGYRKICECVDRAAALSARYMTIHLGIDTRILRIDSIKHASLTLQAVAPYAEKKNVLICVENVFHDNTSIALTDEYVQLFKLITSKQVQFTLDTGHAHIYKRLFELISVAKDRLSFTHIHDNNGEEDQHLIPGHGTIDWCRFMQQLEEINYTGYMNFEIREKCNFKQIIMELEEYLPKKDVSRDQESEYGI